jgi:hypothetical protein
MQHPNIHEMTYGKLIELLNRRYGRTEAQAMVDIQNVKQRNEESVSDYATRMRMAAGPLMPERPPEVVVIQPFSGAQQLVQNPMHPEMLIAYEAKHSYTSRILCTYFLQGMLKNIVQHMRGRAYSTFEECVDAAMEAESFMIQSNSITYSINALKLDEKDTADADVNRIQRRSGTGLEVTGQFSGTFNGACHFCKKHGHRARECPKRNKYGEKAYTELAKSKYREKQKNRYKRFRKDETRERKKRPQKEKERKEKKRDKKGKGKKRKQKPKRVNAVQFDSDGEEVVEDSSDMDSSDSDSSTSSEESSSSSSDSEVEHQTKNV